MKNYIFPTGFILLMSVGFAQTTDQNFVRTDTYKTPSTTVIMTPSAAQATVNITYLDGLGRPIQNVAHKQSAGGTDIVTPIEYDAYSQQLKEYLPYPSSGSSMAFTDNTSLIGNLQSYYITQYGAEGGNPFTEKRIERSPLKRVLEQGHPGTPWVVNPTSDSDHTIKTDYLLNTPVSPTAEKVKLYNANSVWNATYEIYVPTLVNYSGTTFYAPDQLYKTVTKNENWTSGKNNTTEEFKNPEGRVILRRNFNGTSPVAHDTYYVYDQFGNLSYVIPPTAPTTISSTVLNNLCYQYKYDGRNRMAEKKLPGKQWEFIIYDQRDRQVTTGPVYSPFALGTQGWLLTKYDDFDRTAMTGWYAASSFTSTSRKTLQTSYNGAVVNAQRGTSTVDNIAINYASISLPSGFKLLTVNYYDDYNFLSAPLTPLPSTIEGTSIITPTTTVTTKRLSTGGWVRVLTSDSATDGELSYILYDDKERPLRKYTKNHFGGYTYTDSKLTFNGFPEYSITKHKPYSTSSELYTKDAFTYTAQDKLLTQTHQIGTGGTPQLMSKNEYDALGQLKNKKVGGADVTAATYFQKVDFTDNIRGWIKGVNNTSALDESGIPNDLFAFRLNYNVTEGTPITGITSMYNGNISETYWRTGNDNTIRKYGYGYDQLNRMTKAIYQKPLGSVQVTNSYNENVSYDKTGNITSLQRNGALDSQTTTIQIDDLVYAYASTSNRLMKVTDKSNSIEGFSDDSADIDDANDDYDYDPYGNMIRDYNKKIRGISYNHLNLPVEFSFDMPGTNYIQYLYNATGEKLSKMVFMDGMTDADRTDYISGFQYVKQVLQFFPTAEGYVRKVDKQYNYIYNYKDHLGNTRVSYTMDQTTGNLEIVEENNYYPFGLKQQNYNSVKLDYTLVGSSVVLQTAFNLLYKYQYNGKEFQADFNLNWYDYGWRNYDPAVARWVTVDPLLNDLDFVFDDSQLEKDDDDSDVYEAIVTKLATADGIFNTNNLNPYGYGYNNPVSFDDPDGRCPWCIGAIIGAAVDYGMQVAGNLAEGKELGDALTDVDGKSILISAAAGAVGAGLLTKVGKVLKTTDKVVKVTTRTTRAGDKAAKITYKSGKVKDISKTRVKEFKPAPRNPSGKPNQTNFKKNPKDVPKGSQVSKTDPKKRTPTKKEQKQLENAIDTPK